MSIRDVFPVNKELAAKLKITETGLYSVSSAEQSRKIAELIKSLTNATEITDGTANVGGNTYGFSQVFDKVYAVEIDPTEAEVLQHNMETLSVDNVEIVQGDITKVNIPTRVLFVDPPFEREESELSLSGEPVGKFLDRLVATGQFDLIMLKVEKHSPVNSDSITVRTKVYDQIFRKFDLVTWVAENRQCIPRIIKAASFNYKKFNH